MRLIVLIISIISVLHVFAQSAETSDSISQNQVQEVIISNPDSTNNGATQSPDTLITPTRKLTPVDIDDNKPYKPSLHYYDSKGELLDQPVLFLSELDTIKKKDEKPKFEYPTLNAVSIGLNLWDPIMVIAGQKYGGIDIWADLSIHNRFFPVVELGIGIAKDTPLEGNFTYKGLPSMYAKIGANYNFFAHDEDIYQLFAGIRGGFSAFKYEITDISINSSYWNQTKQFNLLDQSSSALYGEALIGIKVKIFNALSMGWTVRFHHLFKCDDAKDSSPWYIPGYGTKQSKLSATLSVIYTIPLNKPKTIPDSDI